MKTAPSIGVNLIVSRVDGCPATNEDVDQVAKAFVEAVVSLGFEMCGSLGLVEDPDSSTELSQEGLLSIWKES